MMALLLALTAVSDCNAAAARSGLDYRQCLGRAEQLADAEMVRQWRATLASVRRENRENRGGNKPDLAQGLLASQRAWLRYRDAECAMIAEQAAGGTGFGELAAECNITLTRRRTEMLRLRELGRARYLR